MAQIPMVSQTSLVGSIPAVVVLGIFIFAAIALSSRHGILYGVAAYFALRLILHAIPSSHRKGVSEVRAGQFSEALPRFHRSFEFFDSRRWLDDYRALFLLSPSAISYREMALANLGFCYAQLGDGRNARKCYERCLELFPESLIASSALAMLDSGANRNDG
ncbi:MAG: tetratricopeptide repeat protein [Planctomycetota bacterium]